jgi:hypothetical protein
LGQNLIQPKAWEATERQELDVIVQLAIAHS